MPLFRARRLSLFRLAICRRFSADAAMMRHYFAMRCALNNGAL